MVAADDRVITLERVAVMTDALWYLARGTGTVSLILLTVVVVLGIGGRSGRPVFGLPRFAVTMVHRNAGPARRRLPRRSTS